jgi:RHS repeat-associated protein
MGRSVMSGKLNNYKGSGSTALNTLATWSTQLHDTTATLSGFGIVLENKSIDALGYATRSWSDGAGRTLRSFDQLDKAKNFTFDANGNQLSVRDPNNVGSEMVYDPLNRNTQSTDTVSSVTKTAYDKEGNATKQTDAKNKDMFTTFDVRNRKKATTDRISAVTNFTYSPLNYLLTLTDAESQTTSYTYSVRGEKLTETYPDHVNGSAVGATGYGMVTFVYDNAGRLLRKQDQLGDTCTYNFDLVGRMTSRNYRTAANSPSGTIADTDSFTFDRAGRMLTAVSGRYSNTVTYGYDLVGRKATESLTTNGQTYPIGTEYNARGELIKYTYPDNTIQDRTYHPTGTLNQLKIDGNTVSTRSYDDGMRLTSEALGNTQTEARTYFNDNTLSTLTNNGSVGNLSYTWDANKNKTSETITGTMANYSFTAAGTVYDFEDRLTGFARSGTAAPAQLSQSWNLTSVGDWNTTTINGTVHTRTHGPTHELLTNKIGSAAAQSVTTDVKGNITSIPVNLRESTATTALNLVWDFDNQLKSADVNADSIVDITYNYDALGRRISRLHSSGNRVYVQAGQQTMCDYVLGNAASNSLNRYVYASYIDEAVVRKGQGQSGTVLYFHRNQQYSTYAITSSAGTVLERYAYTAYGQPSLFAGNGTARATSSYSIRHTYTGREWDDIAGLYYFRARWMSGNGGRFLSRDPIGYTDGLSQYRVNFLLMTTDPTGLCGQGCGPDVTDWFSRQLDTIKEFASANGYRSNAYSKMAKSMKFEKAMLKNDCGPSGSACKNTVTLCGKCINVTELGNIAYGYSLSNEMMDTMIFGGLLAEVSGRGFDSQKDIVASIAGYSLQSTNNICAALEFPKVPNVWGQGVIINGVARANDAYGWYSSLPFYGPAWINVLKEWNDKHGDWEAFVTEALQSLNPDSQFDTSPPPSKSLWEVIGVNECPVSVDCGLPANHGNIKISSSGEVSW